MNNSFLEIKCRILFTEQRSQNASMTWTLSTDARMRAMPALNTGTEACARDATVFQGLEENATRRKWVPSKRTQFTMKKPWIQPSASLRNFVFYQTSSCGDHRCALVYLSPSLPFFFVSTVLPRQRQITRIWVSMAGYKIFFQEKSCASIFILYSS